MQTVVTCRLSELCDLPVHPLADAFPMLSDEDRAPLAASISANGVREPLVLWTTPNGTLTLLDGRNRLAGADAAGLLEVPTVEFDGDDEAAEQFVIDANVNRRHLTAKQKVLATLALAGIEEERARARMLAGKADPSPVLGEGTVSTGATAKILAERFNVSHNYVSAALAMSKDTTGLGAELLEEIRTGSRSMDDIAKAWRGRHKAQVDPRREEYVAPPEPAVPDEEYQAYVESQATAEAEIAEHWNSPEENRTVLPSAYRPETTTPRERATAEALRLMVELDAHVRSHALTDQDILELRGKPHTVAGTAERLSEWLALAAEAIRLNA